MNWQKVLEVSDDRNRKNMNLGLKACKGRVQKGETLVITRPDTVTELQGNMTEAESRAQSVFDRPCNHCLSSNVGHCTQENM